MLRFSYEDIMQWPSRYRGTLLNKVSGLKSANLIGTKSKEGSTNLAIFNSVVHIGANPPYLGFVLRPTTVERHTYENIRHTGVYTINQITTQIHQQAHQTEPLQRCIRQIVHARQCERFIMRKLERLDAALRIARIAAANLADKGAHPSKAGIGVGKRPDQGAGDEHLIKQADVLHGAAWPCSAA